MSDPVSRFQRFTSVVKDAIFLSTLIVSISTIVGGFVFTLAWPHFIAKLQADLNVATRDDLRKFQEQLNQVTGEDRLIRMLPGHSYVTEPVSKGDELDLTMVVSGTRRGMLCNFLTAMPIYIDGRDISLAGEPLPAIKQLSENPERVKLTLTPPATLLPGRAGVALSLKFSCPFGPGGTYIDAFEETDMVFFQLDPPK